MKIVEGIHAFDPPPQGVALTIGNFDGVHRGHQALVETARRFAQPLDAPVVVMTFEPHPLAILMPERAPARLTTLSERLALLERAGADATIVLRTDPELLAQAADEFLRRLVTGCRPRVIVEGPTFHFGHRRAGSVATLREYGPALGYELRVIDERRATEVEGMPAINSSAIRDALRSGDVATADAMLGRPHRLTGIVERGQGRGTPLGFPTANLSASPQMTPGYGVYAAVAQLTDASLHLAAVNIGPQPTFEQSAARVEAHLLDFSGDLVGQRLGLHLVDRLRVQVKFAGVDELSKQIARDIEATRAHGAALERLARAGVISL